MPTGYTHEIAEGITFEKFVMNCARAFGALVLMRDDSPDAEIPERFEPSQYHVDRLKEIESELLKVRKMSLKQCSARAKSDYDNHLKEIEEGIRKAEDLRGKYLSMLSQVRAWQPPSSDHIELKKFMDEQITKSIKFDCGTSYYTKQTPVLLSAQSWKEERLAKLLKDFSYHKKENAEEVERTEGRNTWLRQLRESIKQ